MVDIGVAMQDRISPAQPDGGTSSLSQDDQLEALRIAKMLVEQHGAKAPVQAAYRLYCLAEIGELTEFALTLRAMKLVEEIRPDALVSRDT